MIGRTNAGGGENLDAVLTTQEANLTELETQINELPEPTEEYKGETTVTPTVNETTLATANKKLDSDIKINAVTSAVDENIVAENIKKGITILGVEGAFEGASDLTETEALTDSIQSNLAVYNYQIYGVSGLADIVTQELTRTDDSVGMTYSINTDTGEVTSDFNNVFPYNEMTRETDSNGNVFVNIPSMYFRIGTENGIITDIAVCKSKVPSGTWYKTKAFKYGAYKGSANGDTQIASISGATPLVSITRAVARTRAMASGTGYHLRDTYASTVLGFLFLIEFANKYTPNVLAGATSLSAKIDTGGTDDLDFVTGYNTTTGQMKWHGIEDFDGNLYEWEDGIVAQGAGQLSMNYWGTSDYTKYTDEISSDLTLVTTTYKQVLSSAYNSQVAGLGWNDETPFICPPALLIADGTTYDKGFRSLSVITGDTGGVYVINRGSRYNSSSAGYPTGFFRFYPYSVTSASSSYGCRLMAEV